jgi:hypothetical protein
MGELSEVQRNKLKEQEAGAAGAPVTVTDPSLAGLGSQGGKTYAEYAKENPKKEGEPEYAYAARITKLQRAGRVASETASKTERK